MARKKTSSNPGPVVAQQIRPDQARSEQTRPVHPSASMIRSLPAAVKNALIFAGFIVVAICIYYLSGVIAPFLVSLVVAYIMNPLVRRLVDRKIPRPWAVLTVFIAGFAVFVVFIVPFTLTMITEAGDLITKLGNLDVKSLADNYKTLGLDFYQKFYHYPYIKTYIDEFVQSDKVRELAAQGVILVKDGAVNTFKKLLGFLGGAFSGMFNMFLIPILVFYILLDMDEIYSGFKMLIPHDYRPRTLDISKKLDDQLSSLLRGQVLANSIFAGLMTIDIWFSGLNFFFFLGLFSGIANFIPYLGGLFTMIFALLLAIAQFGFSTALIAAMAKIAVAVVVIQSVDGWYLQPYVVGENAGLHPLVVMLALAIAASLAGIPGMVIAVPAAVILKVLGRELYHELYDQVPTHE
ncbi:MAG: AI-2E family transporter [Candidatus Riflebacteria bacterium]|nr:AI-2E family transporter [Candidatus Riflebacteria bacterium]